MLESNHCEQSLKEAFNRTHKLSGKLKGLWAFVIAYDCRVIFRFLDDQNALLMDINALLDSLKQSWVPNAIISVVASIITKTVFG